MRSNDTSGFSWGFSGFKWRGHLHPADAPFWRRIVATGIEDLSSLAGSVDKSNKAQQIFNRV
jgi:hypothetical protein